MATGVKIHLIGRDKAELLESITYQDTNFDITVLSGFIYDGASIPKFFWSLIGSPFVGSYRRAVVFHDILYDTKALSKSEADKLFLEMMLKDIKDIEQIKQYVDGEKTQNVKKWRAYIRYNIKKWRAYIRYNVEKWRAYIRYNVEKWRAYTMYYAVKFFGGWDWKTKLPKNIEYLEIKDKR